MEDNFLEVAQAVVAAHDSGELAAALAGGHDGYKKWVNGVGKAQKRKGKRLFMPMRVAFTVRGRGLCVWGEAAGLGARAGNCAICARLLLRTRNSRSRSLPPRAGPHAGP